MSFFFFEGGGGHSKAVNRLRETLLSQKGHLLNLTEQVLGTYRYYKCWVWHLPLTSWKARRTDYGHGWKENMSFVPWDTQRTVEGWGEVSLQFFFFPFSSLCPIQQTHELDDATIDLSGNTCGIYKIKDIEVFLVYSEASRYMASSCKNLTGARFWIGSKNIWAERIYVVKTLSTMVFWSSCFHPIK